VSWAVLLVEDDEQDDPLVVLEVMVRPRGDEGGVALRQRERFVLDAERSAAFQNEVQLVPFMRLLPVRFWSGEDVDAHLDAVGLVHDLVATGAEAGGDIAEAEALIHLTGRVDVAAFAVARPWSRGEEGGLFHPPNAANYWISVSSLNMGMYIEMMMMPTMIPTPIIIRGSMTEVRVAIELSTSSS
jgi:hypothetical protein